MVVLFYGISTLFGSFNTELSHFDKFQTIKFSISIIFCLHSLMLKQFYFKQFGLAYKNSSNSSNSV